MGTGVGTGVGTGTGIYRDPQGVAPGSRSPLQLWPGGSNNRAHVPPQGFTAYIGSVQCSSDWLIADGTNNAVVLMDFDAEGDAADAAD